MIQNIILRLKMLKIESIITKRNQWLYCEYKMSRILCQNNFFNITKKRTNKIYFFYVAIQSFILINLVFLYQFFYKKKKIKYDSIFLKVKEGHDYKNIKYLSKLKQKKFIFIYAYNLKDNFKTINVSYKTLIIKFIENLIYFKNSLQYKTDPEINFIYTNISKKIVLNAYFETFYFEIKIIKPDITCYTSGSWFQSLSIINNNIQITLLCHGLLGQFSPLIIPKFDNICVFSEYEKKYLKNNFNFKNIIKYEYETLKNYNSSVIIFLRQSEKSTNKNDLIQIINYFKLNKYKIYIKEHPRSHFNFTELHKDNEIIILNKDDLSYDIFKKISPKFVVGYFSTSLCEALNVGILPITIGDRLEEKNKYFKVKNIDWTIYPIFKKTLSWQDNLKEINLVIKDDSSFNEYLLKLKNV